MCKTRQNAVPGIGNSKSDVIFIGEAPGRNEDKVGKPFVGAAGKKFSDSLEKAGLSRDLVYITNVVKCRPPKNRAPTKNEKEACRGYLDAELEIIAPKIICIMGNTAYNSIFGGDSITKNRGKFLSKDNRLYFLTIHPAATIYNQKLVSALEQDMKKLARKLAELKNN